MTIQASACVVPAPEVRRLTVETGVSVEHLMSGLLDRAAGFARPPISSFRVGAVSRGLTGALYLGANLELEGEALGFAVHAEQASVANAWMHGEEGIDRIAVTAAPCGHCRQFLNELTTASRLVIAMPDGTRTLGELLPHAFGPRDLGVSTGLMQPEDHPLVIPEDDDLALAALSAARRSYAPYSRSWAGVAIRTSSGAVVTGSYAENAAFNPSLPPMTVALSQLNLSGSPWISIAEAVLVHVDGLHTNASLTALGAVAEIPLRMIQARNSA